MNAPGTAKIATRLPLKKSSVLTLLHTAVGDLPSRCTDRIPVSNRMIICIFPVVCLREGLWYLGRLPKAA